MDGSAPACERRAEPLAVTVSTETYRIQYSGNGVTTAFSVPFPFLANSHISVVYTDADSVDTTWVEATHYTLTGAGGASGTLTAVTAPATGTRITIIRNVPLTQTTDYVSNDEFPASTHESNLDKTMMAIQMLQEQLDRAIKVKTSSTAAPVDEADVASAVAALSATAAAAATARRVLAQHHLQIAQIDAHRDKLPEYENRVAALDGINQEQYCSND